jgi:type IV secretory pathway VirD2 relaxase
LRRSLARHFSRPALGRISFGMSDEDTTFEPRFGRMRSGKGRAGAQRALQSLLICRIARGGGDWRSLSSRPARQSGRFNARGRGGRLSVAVAKRSGWSMDRISGMRVRARRVMVKARVVKLAGAKAGGAAAAHLRYLQRDGVTRDGEHGRFYSTFSDDADGKAFLERGADDRHQFRFIVSPEDGAAFETLRSFTRELMAKMEQDLGTTLDWVAVDHFDTGHPHTHLLLRGATEEGKLLNIAGDYIASGIRGRASEIMTRWLGPQSELEVREQLEREIGAERLTKLDRDILARANDHVVDLRQPARWDGDGSYQQLLISRARQLERMGLAERDAPLAWRLDPTLENTLADLGRRGDIIRTMHRVITAAKLDRRPELYVIDRDTDAAPVVGKVVHRGAADDHHDRRYLVIDGVNGRTHYVDVGRNADETPIGSLVSVQQVRPALRKADRAIEEIARVNGGLYSPDIHLAYDASATDEYVQAHVRRLEALRRGGVGVERQPDGTWLLPPNHADQVIEHEKRSARAAPVRIQVLAMHALEREATAYAPSWLDRQLRGEEQVEIAKHGYGGEVRQAMVRRQQWLIDQNLAEQRGQDVLFRSDMDQRLRRTELRVAAARLSKELGLDFSGEPIAGERISGVVRRRVNLSSGSFAVVENSREFTLVPWRPVLERQLGREISGVMRSSGSISWTFGRGRQGPEIGM